MTAWQAIILGIVQGLAEFLPISSSGHLVLVQNIMNIQGEQLLLDTLLHLGTLAAVIIVLWKDIVTLVKHPICKLTGMLALATVPAVVVTLIFQDSLDTIFSGTYLAVGFGMTTVVLLLTFFSRPSRRGIALEQVGWKEALFSGCSQAIAILPGLTRSGSTIVGGLFAGMSRDAAVRFSFLLSIPAILGSLVFQSKDIVDVGFAAALNGLSIWAVVLGTIASAVMGVIALKWMVKIIHDGKLWLFSIYTGALTLFLVADKLFLHWIF